MSHESPQPKRRPRVMIVSASVGAGHNAAADAIVEGLATAGFDADVERIDAVAHAPWWFRLYYSGGFALAMTRFPTIYGLTFRATDRPQRPRRSLEERLRLWRERRIMKPLGRRLRESHPDLIIHTHFLAPPIARYLNRTGQLAAKQFVVVTDIQVHRFWHCEDIDRWFIPAPPSAEPLQRWGIDPRTVTVSGMPIGSKWTRPCDPSAARAAWNLPEDAPVIVLSGGTEFTCGPVAKIARDLVNACPDAVVVVLAGHNKKLLARLSRLAARRQRLRPVAFTDRSHELVHAATLMITKAGGITTAECLAAGTPMILTNPVGGQEGGNAQFMADNGAAVIARGRRNIIARTAELLNDAAALATMSGCAADLYRPGTQTIADAARNALS